MKKQILYFTILIFPFLWMIVINEFVRLNIADKGSKRKGVVAINSEKKYKHSCSWACHDNTAYCKKNHVKFTKSYFDKIDPVYFGIIKFFKSTGNYGLANIIFLVVLLPLFMYFLLVKSISIQLRIRKIKKG